MFRSEDHPDPDTGHTALTTAIARGNEAAVHVILKHLTPANAVQVLNARVASCNGRSALIFAAMYRGRLEADPAIAARRETAARIRDAGAIFKLIKIINYYFNLNFKNMY